MHLAPFVAASPGYNSKGIQEVRTWLVQCSKTVRKGRSVQACPGSRVHLVSRTETASRWPACPMAGSASAIPRIPPARYSGSPRVSGAHLSAAHETENSISSVGSAQIGLALSRPASISHLSKGPREKPLWVRREGLLAYVPNFRAPRRSYIHAGLRAGEATGSGSRAACGTLRSAF